MAKTARSDTPSQGAGEESPKSAPMSLSLLAQEEFGADFHGDVETTPPKKPQDDTEPEPELPIPGEPAEGDDDDVGGGEENVQVEGDDAEAAKPKAEEDDGTEPISTVKDLIEHLEADPVWFEDLKVDVTVNGQPSQVPLRDVVASYRMNQAADERLEQAKLKSTQAQQEIAQRNAALEQQYQIAAQLVTMQEQQLTADVAAIDWDRLKVEDPAMWSAERVRLGERNQQIQNTKQAVAGQFQQALVQQAQDFQTKRATQFQEEQQLLNETMPKVSPDWGDNQKAPAAKSRLMTYLLGQGYGPDEIGNTLDHRAFIVAEKARLWDESQGKVQLSKKRIQSVPRVMKPGARKEPSAINLEKVREAQKRLRTSGHMDDALALLRAKATRR